MAQSAAITLNSVVYSPRGTQNGITTWAAPMGANGELSTLTQSLRGPLDNNNYRARGVLKLPVAREDDSPCGCAGSILGEGIANLTIDIPSTLSPAERADYLARVRAYVASSTFGDLFSFEGTWG